MAENGLKMTKKGSKNGLKIMRQKWTRKTTVRMTKSEVGNRCRIRIHTVCIL